MDGLTLDVDDDLLYWTDVTYQNIQRADLDGGNRRTILKGLDKPRAIVLYKARRFVKSPVLLKRQYGTRCALIHGVPTAGLITSRCSAECIRTPSEELREACPRERQFQLELLADTWNI